MLLRWSILAQLTCYACATVLDTDFFQNIDQADYDYQYVNDNPVVEMEDSGTAVCPPTVGLFSERLCSAAKCASDTDCQLESQRRNADMACCFNGCVRTCMVKIEPPPVFDWDDEQEEKKDKRPMGRENLAELEFQGPDVVVSLPGGCHLTEPQYQSFQNFNANPHIKECYCKEGNVVCDVIGTETEVKLA